MIVSFFDLIVLTGMVQGTIMLVILQLTRPANTSKNILCAILAILVLLSFKILLHTLHLWDTTFFRYFPLAIDTTLQPLFYLYCSSLTLKDFKLNSKRVLHFIPTIIFMLYAIVVYVLALPHHSLTVKDNIANGACFNMVKQLEDWVAVASSFIYWALSVRQIKTYQQWLFNNESDTSLQEFNWLKKLLVFSGILVFALFVISLLENVFSFGRQYFIHLELFYVYLAFITYYLSFKGYLLYTIPNRVATGGVFPPDNNTALNDQQRFEKKLPDQDAIKTAIINALQNDQLFLDPELSLKDLAKKINYPISSVSLTINQSFNMNFRNLVNSYRVEEVKKRLKQKDNTLLSLLGIALDCGFNSEASFYRVFRKHARISPNDYIRSLKQP